MAENVTETPAPEPAPAVALTARVSVQVWDLPVRIVHGLIVVGIGVSWWTAETGRLEWHRWSGYGLLGLLLFRLYWGVVGSSTARFAQFVRGPRAIVSYLKGGWVPSAGHNPLGALSVLALLGLLLAQIVLGLFAVDVDGIESGPLSEYVSFEAGRLCAEWHEGVFNALMAVIVLHILAVLYYLLVRKQNLIGAMVTGRRQFISAVTPVKRGSWLRLIIGIVVATLVTWAVSRAFHF